MLVVMRAGASDEQLDAVLSHLPDRSGDVVRLPGRRNRAISAPGVDSPRRDAIGALDGVDSVVPLAEPFTLSAAAAAPEATSFEICGRRLGGGETLCVIAGPCTVETRDGTLATARAVERAGASMLRGGAFKPRTSPFAFRGLGVAGLEILAEAREATGLPVVTELLAAEHAEDVARYADVIQIGARNMQNYALLEIAGALGRPVLLKRGLSSTLDELLMAADYVLKEGNERVVLCERGIRTFETAMRFTLDLGAVPWLKLHSHLPVIVDPSHAAGDRRLVAALARAAVAVGADGLLIEVSDDPDTARCDGAQMLRVSGFAELAAELRDIAGLLGRRLA